jgi:phosphoribosylformylglycinamidine synthase
MVLAVPPQNLPALQTLCDTFNTELTDIGAVTDTGRIRITYGGETVLDLENEFLHNGIPQRRLVAALPAAEQETNGQKMRQDEQTLTPAIFASQLYALLSSPNIASKAPVIRLYDHEVQGACAVKPLTGIEMDAPSDAAVLKPMGVRGSRGIVLSNGINPEYGKRDSYKMAWAVIDEAIRNAVAVGADPQRIALLDNFCWGDPTRPETMGSLVQAARGCYDAALFFQAPFISGKDSLNNEYLGADGLRHSIPPTLLISALGMVEDVSAAVTMDFKAPGSDLYIVGDFQPLFGGSQLAKLRPDWNLGADPLPSLSPHTPQVYRALHQAIRAGLVLAAHDLSEGGLAVTAAEMCIGGRMGAALKFGERDEALRVLFGETTGCLLVEVAPQHRRAFLDFFADLPFTWVGKTASHPHLDVTLYGAPVLHASLDEILQAFAPPSP